MTPRPHSTSCSPPSSGTWQFLRTLPALALRRTHAAGRDAVVPGGRCCSLSASTEAMGTSKGTSFPFVAAYTPALVVTLYMSHWRTHRPSHPALKSQLCPNLLRDPGLRASLSVAWEVTNKC